MQSYSVQLKGLNSHCIDVGIKAENGDTWRASFVYGEPRKEKRHEFWVSCVGLKHSGMVLGLSAVTLMRFSRTMSILALVIVLRHK
jgi:hypothetical protein